MGKFTTNASGEIVEAFEKLNLKESAGQAKEVPHKIVGVTVLDESKLQTKNLAKLNMFMAFREMFELKPTHKIKILRQCGKNITREGIRCPHCKCSEVYRNANESLEKAYFVIRAYKVTDEDGTDWSHCLNCEKWF